MFRLFLPMALILTACSAIPEQERTLLTAEVDCARAEQDIAGLEAARPGDARKARVLVSSLAPAGFILGVATNDFGNRERVLSGAYEADLDARIALIREACSLPAAAG